MMLTGKAKEMFEGWYLKLPNAMGLNYGAFDITMNRFYCLPESMQWGIYQDWADHIGYHMHVSKGIENDKFFWNINFKYGFEAGKYSLRQEARDAAIAKLNEIINEK